MSNLIGDIIVASVQSVAKVYIIGAIGFCSVKFPRKEPYLPSKVVSVVARFSFNVLTISLIYSTTAMAVSPQSIGDYWFVFAGALCVITISYVTATLLGYVFRIDNPRDFSALRIAASFPNIVALPILIFPSLCEYSVVVESLLPAADTLNEENGETSGDRQEQCVTLSNTMIFCYFFAYSLFFWSFGHPQLMAAARMSTNGNNSSNSSSTVTVASDSERNSTEAEERTADAVAAVEEATQTEEGSEERGQESNQSPGFLKQLWAAVRQVLTSNGFLAMMAGFLTGCIPPLQEALFDEGGVLRFLGSSVQTLGVASSPLSTLITAASLVPPAKEETTSSDDETRSESVHAHPQEEGNGEHDNTDEHESATMTDPQSASLPAPRRRRRRDEGGRSLQQFAETVRDGTTSAIKTAVPRARPDTLRLLAWFVASRLVVSPAIVTAIIAVLDNLGVLAGVPPMAKLVVLINSCLPGAQMVVVLLKSQEELADSAQAVASVYLPSYLLSCVTIAGWSSFGLWLVSE